MTAERLSFSEVRGTYLDLRVDRLSDGTLGMTIEDVTGTVAVEERLRHQASHDALTWLPNRTLLEERLPSPSPRSRRRTPSRSILVDVDRLRDINESYGLHLGDQLLVDIGRRLVRDVRGSVDRVPARRRRVRRPDACRAPARPRRPDRANAVALALDRPFDVEGHLIDCRVSVGVVQAPRHADDAAPLLRLAHQRALDEPSPMTAASPSHEPRRDSSSIHRLALLSELRQGLANQDLELRYQPLVDLRSGRVARVEAVLRWQHDEDSARMPMEFLELAEQSGLIQPLTRWILGETARAATVLARTRRPRHRWWSPPTCRCATCSTPT